MTDGLGTTQQHSAMPQPLRPALTKEKTIRLKVSGGGYLEFNSIRARIVFNEPMTDRATDEKLMEIALQLLKQAVEQRVANGDQFIEAESLLNSKV